MSLHDAPWFQTDTVRFRFATEGTTPTLSTRSILQPPQLLAGILLTCSLANTLFGNWGESVGFATQLHGMAFPNPLCLCKFNPFPCVARFISSACPFGRSTVSRRRPFPSRLSSCWHSPQINFTMQGCHIPYVWTVASLGKASTCKYGGQSCGLMQNNGENISHGSLPESRHNGIGKAGPNLSTSLVPCHPVFPELSP